MVDLGRIQVNIHALYCLCWQESVSKHSTELTLLAFPVKPQHFKVMLDLVRMSFVTLKKTAISLYCRPHIRSFQG